jgi:hypothetical protein
MIEAELEAAPADRPRHSGRDAIALYLIAHRGEWIDGLALAKIGGAYAWRTRLSECHTQLGMVYENRQTRDGRRVVRSEYRYNGNGGGHAG